MKKTLCIILSIVLQITFIVTGNATIYNKNGISVEYIQNAKITTSYTEEDIPIIILSNNNLLSIADGNHYMKENITIIPQTVSEFNKLYEELLYIKAYPNEAKASGTLTDSEWFYGSSLCIGSTIYYTTRYTNGIKYGKINSVYVTCSTNSGTFINSIELLIGEIGIVEGGGTCHNTKTFNISNNSTINYPTNWHYLLWDANAGSSTGASVYVTVHRGTSSPRTYVLHNYAIGL